MNINDYTDSLTCKMLEVRCVCCGRALLDSVSVSLGMGPECRKNFDGGISNENREKANKIVRDAACSATRGRISEVLFAANQIEEMGMKVLADKMRKRFVKAESKADIEITIDKGFYSVITPYRRKDSKDFVMAWRNIPGRVWVNGKNVIPVESKRQIWLVLQRFFGGRIAKGPKGLFKIVSIEEPEQMKLFK